MVAHGVDGDIRHLVHVRIVRPSQFQILAVILEDARHRAENLDGGGHIVFGAERVGSETADDEQSLRRKNHPARKVEAKPAQAPGMGRMERVVERHVRRRDVLELHILVLSPHRMIKDLVDYDGTDSRSGVRRAERALRLGGEKLFARAVQIPSKTHPILGGTETCAM